MAILVDTTRKYSFIKNTNPYLYAVLFLLVNGLLVFIEANFIVTENLLINHYDAILTTERIEKMLKAREEFWWAVYVFLTIYYLVKFFLVSLVYLTGVFMANYRARFRHILAVVIVAEFIFFIPRGIRIVWFSVVQQSYTFTDTQNFDWYSLKGYISSEFVLKYLSYPLHTLNLFELVYIMVSTILFSRLLEKKLHQGLLFVFATYGIGLVVWSTIIVSLNFYLK